MLGVSILQELDGAPDRQAIELLRYHAGWNFALNRQLGDSGVSSHQSGQLRHRLEEHDQSALGFTMVLDALQEAGLVSRQSRQRLDSTQMFGRVARMSRLDVCGESLRLALQELEPLVQPEGRPLFWVVLWERYVESQTDYRASSEVLAGQLAQAGTDAWQLLQWLSEPRQSAFAAQPQRRLLARVFAEQFEIQAGRPATLGKEKLAVAADGTPAVCETTEAPRAAATVVQPEASQDPIHRATNPAAARPAAEEPTVAVAAQVVSVAPQAGAASSADTSETRSPGQSQTPGQAVENGLVSSPRTKRNWPPTACKPTRSGSDLRGQGPGRREEGACGLQVGGRDGVRSEAGRGRADAQFHYGHGDPSGL